jgi:hypothetical protein
MSPTLASLPATTRDAAGGSISATQAVAAQLGTAGRALLGPANDAFVSAMHVTSVVAAIIALAGAIVVLRWMPGLSSTSPVTPAAPPTAAAPPTPELEPAALDAAAAPGIDPLEALDVWQEHLTTRAAAVEATGAVDPADEYLVDVWPGDFADQAHGVEG